MFSYSNLPLSLLALLVTALPALSGPTTPYGPFYNIAIHAPKPPEQPICCLRPLTPLEETDQEVLLTFEEWKARRLAEVHKDPAAGSHIPSPPTHKSGATEDVPEPPPSPSGADTSATSPVPVVDVDVPSDQLSPHIQIPIVDRFNYASLDCSASVHNAHKSAKSASSILSSKKDRYMLSPCAEKQQFVVVELCDDIRIDTVQLANYEFFSGVFKDFSVSVAKTIQGGWVPAGTYRAKNSRGVQVRPYSYIYAPKSHDSVDVPSTVPHRLLPIHTDRFPLSLWQRVLLSFVPATSVRSDASGALEMGYVGG